MSHAFFQQLFDEQQTAVLVFDTAASLCWINEAAERLLCVSRKQVTGEQLSQLLPANPELGTLCTQVLNAGQSLVARDQVLHLPVWQRSTRVDYMLTPIQPDSGDASTGPWVMVEMHEAERRARLSDEAQQAGQFHASMSMLRGLSHEIKNPLAGIRGAAQLLSRLELDTASEEEVHAFTEVMIKEVDRLTLLVSRMSAMNHLPEPTLCNVHDLIEHCLQLLQSEYPDLSIGRDYDTSLPDVSLDRDQWVQVLLNLLKNAAQAVSAKATLSKRSIAHGTERGAMHILVRTRVAFPEPTRVAMPGTGVQISIHDSGAGVTQNLQDQLFLPMVSGKADGTGLGLAIAQEIVRQHHGFIRLDEAEGGALGGAEFSLFLPFEGGQALPDDRSMV